MKAKTSILCAAQATIALCVVAPHSAAQSTGYAYDAPGQLIGISSLASNAPAILVQPATQVVEGGGTVVFGVVASGAGELSYQWLSNGVPIGGANSDSLVFTNISIPANLVSNGSFELPSLAVGYVTRATGLNLDGWIVESGNVDSVFSTWWAEDGVQSLDLNGSVPGAIYQDIATVPNQQYFLRFALAGNPNVAAIKTNSVWWNGVAVATNTFVQTGHTTTKMGWTNFEYLVTATNSMMRLRFASLSPGAGGPALDNVSLYPVISFSGFSVIVSNSSGSVTSSVAALDFDLDHNGLGDNWERTYLGAPGQLANADRDGDGISNYNEFLEGTDPSNPASFRPRLDVGATPGGVFSFSPVKASYALNDLVQITATPDAGNFFLRWVDGVSSTNPVETVLMDATKTATAVFAFGLTNGAAYDGEINNGGTNFYGFIGTPGETVLLRVGELSNGGGFDPLIQIFSPDGVLLGSQSSATASEIALTTTNTGLFVVAVSDGTASGILGSGTYRLHFVKLPGSFTVTPGDEAGVVTNGGFASGAITPGDFDLWSFSASAGDSILLRVGEMSDDGGFDPLIRLYGPDGELIAAQHGYAAAEIATTATNSGTFTVIVSDTGYSYPYRISDTGTYRLYLAKSPGTFVVPDGDDGGPLANGGNGDGTIDTGDLDVWSFSANAGEPIVVRVGETADDNAHFDPWIRLYGPAGALLGSQYGYAAAEIAVTATNTGMFTVVVSDAPLSYPNYVSDTGSYTLHLAKFPGAFSIPEGDEGGSLENGGIGEGSIPAGDLDLWDFTANAGDSIVLRVGELTDTNAHFDPWIRLYGPTGALLDSRYGYAAAEIAVTATNGGTFSVLVGDAGLSYPNYVSDTGTYRVYLAKAPGNFVVSDDGAEQAPAGIYSGAINVGDLDLWSFKANTGDPLGVQIDQVTDDNGHFDPWIRLYGPDGVLLNSASGAASAHISRVATNSGVFTIIVADGNNSYPNYVSDTGTYQLTISGIAGPPQFSKIEINGSKLILAGAGTANSQFTIFSATNLATASWIPLATNVFSAEGTFLFTNEINGSQPQQYFRFTSP